MNVLQMAVWFLIDFFVYFFLRKGHSFIKCLKKKRGLDSLDFKL